jgi:c-di-GMP-binding flagellar brake protein YcgR
MSKRVVFKTPHTQAHPLPAGALVLEDPLQIQEAIKRAANQNCKVSIKILGTDEQFDSRLLDAAQSERVEVEVSSDLPATAFNSAITKSKTKNCLVLIFVGRYLLGLMTEYEKSSPRAISFTFPKKIFKIQRRKNVRYAIPAGYDVTVDCESLETHLRVKRKVLDISEGGLAFFLEPGENLELYKVGAVLRDCILTLRNQTLKLSLRVANQIQVEVPKLGVGHKVGMEFIKISEQNRNFLAAFIYSQLGQLMS